MFYPEMQMHTNRELPFKKPPVKIQLLLDIFTGYTGKHLLCEKVPCYLLHPQKRLGNFGKSPEVI